MKNEKITRHWKSVQICIIFMVKHKFTNRHLASSISRNELEKDKIASGKQAIVQITETRGQNIFECRPSQEPDTIWLMELAPKLRNLIWIKRCRLGWDWYG